MVESTSHVPPPNAQKRNASFDPVQKPIENRSERGLLIIEVISMVRHTDYHVTTTNP
jgi:hypothetical protein